MNRSPDNRRTFLRGLATLPLIGGGVALASAPALAGSDTALIAHVETVKRLQAAEAVITERANRLDEKARTLVTKPRPVMDREAITQACMKVLLQFHGVTPEVDQAVLTKRIETETAIRAEMTAWDARSEEIRERVGCGAAERLRGRITQRMVRAILDLAVMRATTLEGLIAKASVLAVPTDNDYLDDHHQKLAESVVRDLMVLGSCCADEVAELSARIGGGA